METAARSATERIGPAMPARMRGPAAEVEVSAGATGSEVAEGVGLDSVEVLGVGVGVAEADETNTETVGQASPPIGSPSARVSLYPVSTSPPGLGITTLPWGVVQPLPMLATNMSGNPERPEPPVPVIVTAAQFMYISGLALVWANQVHAKITFPGVVSSGTVNEKGFPGTGQPPMNVLTTLKVAPLSSEIDAWQDPPL